MHANLGGALFSALSSSSHPRPSVSSVPSRSRDLSDVFSPSFFSPQSARHPSKASLAAQHARHRSVSQSHCISICRVLQIAGRTQSCDKLQQSSGLVCARKSLPSDLLLVCATCVSPKKNRKSPVPTRAHSLECGVCDVW